MAIRRIGFSTVCLINDCGKPTGTRDGVCGMHYNRMHRYGTYEKKPIKGYTIGSNGYLITTNKEHPLADKHGRLYMHRMIAFDANISMICHVCNAQQSWDTCHVDHLDDDKLNNNINNLAVACPTCNQSRGNHKMIATAKANGKQLTYNGVTMCSGDWAKRLGISRPALAFRLANWDVDKTFNTPKRKDKWDDKLRQMTG